MAFVNLWRRLTGTVSGLPPNYAQTLVNDALDAIYEANNWSWQIQESGWITPSEVTAGTITTVLGASTVTFDATAKAAIAAIPAGFLVTQMQVRLPDYALYDVVAYNAGTGVATLDRPWSEPAGAGQSYMLYQAYYTSPVADFKRWLSVRDFTNACALNWWGYKQKDIDMMDPQRTVFQNPDRVVPYKVDTRAGTSTPGYMRFELYPQPLATLPYSLYFLRKGPLLSAPTDTVPYPLTEKLVFARARMLAYEWKEAQKGEGVKRGSGADYRFLYQAAEAEYDGGPNAKAGAHCGGELLAVKKVDRDIYDQSISTICRRMPAIGAPYYSAQTGQANVGNF